MARRLSERYRRQVKDESRLRFGGQRREIRAAAQEVEQTYRGDVRTAKQAARGAKRAAKTAGPIAKRALSDALATVTQGPTPGVSTALGNMGAAATRDAEGAKKRLAETLANTKTELAARITDTEAGKTSAIRQARATRASELKGLGAKMAGVRSDAGAFKQGRLGELVEGARDRRVTKRGQDVTRRNAKDRLEADAKKHADNIDIKRGIDPVTGKKLPKKAGESKKPRATAQQKIDAESAVALARKQAAKLRATRGRSEIADLLVTGRESSSVEDTDPKSPTFGQKLKVPGVKKVDEIWASVALDLEFDGKISRKNADKLRSLGYRPRKQWNGKVAPTRAEQRRAGNKAVNQSPGSDRAQG